MSINNAPPKLAEAFMEDSAMCVSMMTNSLKKTLSSDSEILDAECTVRLMRRLGADHRELQEKKAYSIDVDYTIELVNKEAQMQTLKNMRTAPFLDVLRNEVLISDDLDSSIVDEAKSESFNMIEVQSVDLEEVIYDTYEGEVQPITYALTLGQWHIEGFKPEYEGCPCDRKRVRQVQCVSSLGVMVDPLEFCSAACVKDSNDCEMEKMCVKCPTSQGMDNVHHSSDSSGKLGIAALVITFSVIFLLNA